MQHATYNRTQQHDNQRNNNITNLRQHVSYIIACNIQYTTKTSAYNIQYTTYNIQHGEYNI